MTRSREKQFYLQTFRRRAFVVYLAPQYHPRDIGETVAELVDNQTAVVVISAAARQVRAAIPLHENVLAGTGRGLIELSTRLLEQGVAWVWSPRLRRPIDGLLLSCRLGLRLGASKLVLVDPRGGLNAGSGCRSFVTISLLARWIRSRKCPEWSRAELVQLLETVRSGMESINVTRADLLADELFSYEGAGTLISRSAYCSIAPLRLEDHVQACDLLERGEREGFLLRRTPRQRARLLLCAYGAWLTGKRLAGIGSLESEAYRGERVAEIAGLYTITRFHGEGVGFKLVRALVREAGKRDCDRVFACTSNQRAARFFERAGFVRVARSAVPVRKWRGRRGTTPAVFMIDTCG